MNLRSRHVRFRALLLPFLLAVLAAPAHASWVSLGRFAAPARSRDGLLFRGAQGSVAVTATGNGIVRVRFVPAGASPRETSFAVTGTPPRAAAPQVEVGPESSKVRAGSLTALVRHDPLRISFLSGEAVIDEDDAGMGMASSGAAVRVWKRLRDDEHFYGFGEKTGPFDKRGNKLGGVAYAMWNSDTFGYGDDTDPLYVSVPFFLVMRQGRSHGVFFDNTFRSFFDVGKEAGERLSFGAVGGALDYYLIDGPSPKAVLERYTALTGRTPLPPLWALGYHQCRYSYYPESRVRFIARNLRERRIPADAIWLDGDYQDGYRPFTWDRERFPDPARLIADLKAEGLRTVVIVDPHPKKEAGYPPYETGIAGGHLVKRPDGSVFEAPVWPSQAEKNPGPSVFPDFTRSATRRWWGSLHEGFLKLGVAGIWNDMNEPAVFETATGTFPLDVRHDGEGVPTDHREIHNVYGMLMSQATHEGLLALRPNERPFVLTRASFAGGQRWAAVWPGDNVSTWTHLQRSIPLLLGLGLSGFPFVGADIGGFAGSPTAELYTRWLQSAVFAPFMRTHAMKDTPEQDPWSYGTRHEEANRRAIELRYELLPEVYNAMEEASRTGIPAMRPLLLEYPDDPIACGVDDQVLLGADLMLAPVLSAGAERWGAYLPKGAWYDFWTGERHEGGKVVRFPVTLDSIPLFVRGGAFVFRQPVLQHTGERAGKPLRVDLYPEGESSATLYEDDGETLAYRSGVFLRRRFSSRPTAGGLLVEVSQLEGSYEPPARRLELRIRWSGTLERVLADGKPLAQMESAKAGGTEDGFLPPRDGWVLVRWTDPSGPRRIELLR